jgi:hypothetical protein
MIRPQVTLPPALPATVPITIAGHVFIFRRMTWRDDMRFMELQKKDPLLSLLAYAMVEADGRPIGGLAVARKIIMGIPRPVRSRLTVLYRGSLPSNRLLEATLPKLAPEPKAIQAVIEQEEGDGEQEAEDYLDRKYGHQEASSAREQEQSIAQAAGFRGATAPLPDVARDDEEPYVEAGASEQPTSRRYAAVL